jgi:starch phosphorylase
MLSAKFRTKSRIAAAGPKVVNPIAEQLRAAVTENGQSIEKATTADWYHAVATNLRKNLLRSWVETWDRQMEGKRANYLSLEYLLGPNTQTAMDAAKLGDDICEALLKLGADPNEVVKYELDPGLGNGGLGRLAACFLDSGANLHLPMAGYGLFYRQGFFKQKIVDGKQTEEEDLWTRDGNPWEVRCVEVPYTVKFFGRQDTPWQDKYTWADAVEVKALAHDIMVPSYDGKTVNNLRLWDADLRNFDFKNEEAKELLWKLNYRLYPDDSNDKGKKLRLMQEYFFTSLSLQDVVNRHLNTKRPLEQLAETAAIQLNDTHPAIAVAELMRLLVDEHGMKWDKARDITRNVCFYTNHTLMPEALEAWNRDLMKNVLPRHVGIIEQLNRDLMADAEKVMGGMSDVDKAALRRRISIIDEKSNKVRMGHLAAFYSKSVNGVSMMHSLLVKNELFPDLVKIRGPKAAYNHTNGITPRRWLVQANPDLANLITETMGNDEWITDLPTIDKGLEKAQHDPRFRAAFTEIKLQNKQNLADMVKAMGGPELKANALYDIQIKRFHEYKRQFMNILHTVALYQDILDNPDKQRPDTVKIFAGKAAPSYAVAKENIELANWLANKINNDKRVGDKLKVAFIEDYNVSKAQVIVPAADISEQISTAGTEASGTSNMKFTLNGALTMGTRDGANVEIGQRASDDNIFFFGNTVDQIRQLDEAGYKPKDFLEQDPRLKKALQFLQSTPFANLANEVFDGDHWKIAADFKDYWEKQEDAREMYMHRPAEWLTKSIINTRAGSHFSSDDTIRGYGRMWGIAPTSAAPVPRIANENRSSGPTIGLS